MSTIRRLPRVPSLVVLAALAACARTEPLDAPAATDDALPLPAARAALGDTITLAVGATARFEAAGVTATFVRVAEDSRCPLNVTCVWQGDGEVVLDLASEGVEERAVLHTGLAPRSIAFGGVVIELVALSPEPVDDPLADPAAYRASLVARSD